MAVVSSYTFASLTDGRTVRDIPKQHREKKTGFERPIAYLLLHTTIAGFRCTLKHCNCTCVLLILYTATPYTARTFILFNCLLCFQDIRRLVSLLPAMTMTTLDWNIWARALGFSRQPAQGVTKDSLLKLRRISWQRRTIEHSLDSVLTYASMFHCQTKFSKLIQMYRCQIVKLSNSGFEWSEVFWCLCLPCKGRTGVGVFTEHVRSL